VNRGLLHVQFPLFSIQVERTCIRLQLFYAFPLDAVELPFYKLHCEIGITVLDEVSVKTDVELLNNIIASFSYNPESGTLTWVRKQRGRPVGSRAGTPNKRGEILVQIDGKHYYAHRIAWVLQTGNWPKDMIDHANGNPSDNRWSNLREASASDNQHNKRVQKNNKSGIKGAHFCSRSKKFRAGIRFGGKYRHLGMFNTAEEAGRAYAKAAREQWGEFARDG
jgi:hypothetical protein